MKVLVIGGSGAMGRAAVRAALSFDFIQEIVVAGIDVEIATRFVDSLNDTRVHCIYLDVMDRPQLLDAMRQVDVVLNAAGPFFRFGVPILSAAIETAKHYCDICDDWQPTVEMLALHQQAQQKNITAIIGLGASPGVLNLLCAQAAAELDQVDQIVSAWKLSGAVNADDGFSPAPAIGAVDAAAVHLMHCLSEDIQVIEAGKAIKTRALQHSQIDFPTFGPIDVWSLGHPEAITLPRTYTQLQQCYNGMLEIGDIVDDLRQMADAVAAGQLSVDDAARALTSAESRDSRQQQLGQHAQSSIPNALAFAAGIKNGQAKRVGAYFKHSPAGGMATITGIPLALFLPLLHGGHLKQSGVFAPEQVIEPQVFFDLFDPFCGAQGAGVTVLSATDA